MKAARRSLVCLALSVVLTGLFSMVAWADSCFAITTLEQKGTDYVYLAWEEWPGAEGYALYRAQGQGEMGHVKDVSGCETCNYGLENGKSYTYAVWPYVCQADGTRQYLAQGQEQSIQIGVKTPENLRVQPSGETGAGICWDGDPLADHYLLYRSTDGKSWSLVKKIEDCQTITYGLSKGQTYYFRVKAARQVGKTLRYSGYSTPVSMTQGLAAPGWFSVTGLGKNTLSLAWEQVPGATGYRLYRGENGGPFSLVKTVTGTKTTNYNLNPDTTYTYRVAAIAEYSGKVIKGAYADTTPVRLSLAQVTGLAIEKQYGSGVRLRWEPVAGATGYRLYRQGEDGGTTLVKTVADCQTDTYSLKPGQCYSFSVKPICECGQVTVNGAASDPTAVFFAPPSALTVSQLRVNALALSWTEVPGAEGYQLEITQGTQSQTMTCSGLETEISLAGEENVTISLCAVRRGLLSPPVQVTALPVWEESLMFSSATARGTEEVSLVWEPVPGATDYELQRAEGEQGTFATLYHCEGPGHTDQTVTAGRTYRYRYRVCYGSGETLWGNWSETATVAVPGARTYRALVIGQENYETPLNGPINDMAAMSNMLSGLKSMDWQIWQQADATREEIVALIGQAFDQAGENDVSLFYYSGHGVTDSGDHYAGALMTVDHGCIPMQDLAELLSAVPGRVIVLLDSCGSGAAISTQTAGGSGFDPAVFNAQVVSAFSRYAEEKDRSGELAGEKFLVLTASAYEQNACSVKVGELWGGIFTRSFVDAVGYDFNTGAWQNAMPGDGDGDRTLTLAECYAHCAGAAANYQDVQVYPKNSSAELLFR